MDFSNCPFVINDDDTEEDGNLEFVVKAVDIDDCSSNIRLACNKTTMTVV